MATGVAREMSNWVFLYDDAVTEIANTVIDDHSAEVAGFVAENILDTDRQTVYKTSVAAGTVTIEVDLLSAQSIVGFGLLNHNFDTKSGDQLQIRRSAAADAGWATEVSYNPISTLVGDDDFFGVFAAAASYRYWAINIPTMTTANSFVGRFFLARSLYQLERSPEEIMRGFNHDEQITKTLGGNEARNDRGPLLNVLDGMVQYRSTTERDGLVALVNHVNLNHKTFVCSSPFGTTAYAGANRYGRAIHGRFDFNEWMYQMLLTSRTTIPLRVVEVP